MRAEVGVSRKQVPSYQASTGRAEPLLLTCLRARRMGCAMEGGEDLTMAPARRPLTRARRRVDRRVTACRWTWKMFGFEAS